MQQERMKWRADRGTRACKRLDLIEASITALDDEDLLDLQDIFRSAITSPLGEMAMAEISRRGLTAS